MGAVRSGDDHFAELMRSAQAGHPEAYLELLETITPMLRRVIRRQRLLSGVEDVEDLVQDVLLSVHSVRHTFDPGRPFMPWLLAIVRNRLADAARRRARTSAHERVVDDLEVTFFVHNANPGEGGYGDPEALQHAIEGLPAGQRQAIELLKLRQLSLKEAAAASGMTVGALKVATHRAMMTLRRLLTAR
jgi:RNA polymerase sigma-70 factor (ECF subfamily)